MKTLCRIMGTASVKCCEKAKGLMWTPGMLGEDSLPLHLPHRLPFTRWLPHLPSVKLAQVLKKQARKTNLDPEAGKICWWHLVVAHSCWSTTNCLLTFIYKRKRGQWKQLRAWSRETARLERHRANDVNDLAGGLWRERRFLCALSLFPPQIPDPVCFESLSQI